MPRISQIGQSKTRLETPFQGPRALDILDTCSETFPLPITIIPTQVYNGILARPSSALPFLMAWCHIHARSFTLVDPPSWYPQCSCILYKRSLSNLTTALIAASAVSQHGTPLIRRTLTRAPRLARSSLLPVYLCETWIPVIKELFRLSSQSPSSVKIRSAWVIERPNHGEAALINAKLLKEHYSVLFPSLQYASAIHAFLTSDFLSASERNNLVGVGHSGGGGSLIQAVEYGLRDGHNIPLRSLVLVEAPFIGPEVWPFFQVLYDAVKRSNVRRATRWPSKDAAMKWFRTHLPWKTFSPEVLRIVEDTYFIPDMDHPGFITTKTAVEQETACFVDTTGTHLLATSFFRTIADVLPTHIIAGSAEDFWPPGVYLAIVENTTQVRSQLASVTVIDDVGHYIPTVKPHDLAATVFQTVARKLPSNLSKL